MTKLDRALQDHERRFFARQTRGALIGVFVLIPGVVAGVVGLVYLLNAFFHFLDM